MIEIISNYKQLVIALRINFKIIKEKFNSFLIKFQNNLMAFKNKNIYFLIERMITKITKLVPYI